MTTPTPEAAVEAAFDALVNHSISVDLNDSINPTVCRCGERFPSLLEYRAHVARAALTAARPLMEAEGINRVYSIHEPSESDENLRARCRGCGRCWVESADQPGRYIKACPTIEALGLGVWAATIAERTNDDTA